MCLDIKCPLLLNYYLFKNVYANFSSFFRRWVKKPICKINDGMRERKISRDTDKSRQPLIKSSDFFKQEIIRKQISLLNSGFLIQPWLLL